MSDAPGGPPKGATAPQARPMTQVSASAVPSTLESPKDPARPTDAAAGAAGPGAARADSDAARDEINGAAVIALEATVRDDSARDAALRDLDGGPATQMSPPVAAMGPPRDDLTAGPAVVNVPEGELAHAFVGGHGSAQPPYMGHGQNAGFGGHPAGHGYNAGAGHAHGAQEGRRAMSTTTLALLIGGAVVVVLGIGIVGIALFVFLGRRPPDLPSRGVSVEPEPPRGSGFAPPGGGRAQGGIKARLVAVSATPLDAEGVRGAVASATTRIDSCFVGSELEPPNHETAAYDLDVSAAGVVTRADAPERTNRCAKLDACMTQTLRSVRMPKSPAGGAVRLTFTARIAELQQTR